MSEHPGHREGLRERLLARVKRGFHITDTDVADLLREAVEALQRVEPERDEWKEVAEFKQAEAMKYHNLYAALEGALTARAEECRALADKTRSEDVIGAAVYRRIAKELDVLRLAVSAAGGSAPPQEAEHYDTGNPQHCHSCAISALIVAEATRTALEAEKATAEEGRLSALRHCARLEKQLTALEGALKAKAEEWEVEAATCENRRGIENFKRDPQRFAILTRVARELRAILSSPAAAGSAGQEKEPKS